MFRLGCSSVNRYCHSFIHVDFFPRQQTKAKYTRKVLNLELVAPTRFILAKKIPLPKEKERNTDECLQWTECDMRRKNNDEQSSPFDRSMINVSRENNIGKRRNLLLNSRVSTFRPIVRPTSGQSIENEHFRFRSACVVFFSFQDFRLLRKQ